MAHYRIQVHCNACGGFHLLPLAVTLQEGPTERKSIEDAYHGKDVPDVLTVVSKTPLKCPETAKPFTVESNTDIFLVPLEQ